MGSRAITGTTPTYPRATIRFRQVAVFVDSATYLTAEYSAVTSAAGAFSVAVPVPDVGTIPYLILLPDGTNVGVFLGAGAATTLELLLAGSFAIGDAADVLAAFEALITAHAAALDPHPGYLTAAEANAAYSLLGHAHTFGSLTSIPTTLAGYGIVDAAALVHTHAAGDVASGTLATARLGSGTADNTTFLRGDQTWATPAGGGGTIDGSGTAGRVAEWLDTDTLQASTLIKSGAGVLTLSIVGTQTWRSTANNSIGIGSGSLAAITTGTGNVALGSSALNAASTASNNFALGSSALQSCTGDSNIGIGTTAMSSTGAAYTNVGIGETVMVSNSTGSNNVAIGAYALLLNSTGSNNVAIGYEAGRASTGGAGVYLGFQAGRSDTTAGKLYIENSLSTRPLIKGDFSADTLTFFATDSATNAVRTQTTLDYSSSGTPAAGFGSRALVALKSSTTDSQSASDWATSWATATHASRKARIVGTVYDTAAREWIRGEASGTAAMIGLYGAAAVVQPAAIAAPAGGGTIDTEARTAIGLILTALGAAAGGIGITA